MKRLNIIYGGESYSVGDRDLDDVLAEIAAGLAAAEPRWLSVNYGEGVPRKALLLLSQGVDIAVIPVPGFDEDADQVSDEPPPPRAR
ncbi:hypothetical protein B7R54_04500 [Subtercola boreus]|uniref:Uncharacterized protein n=1 Tax=Subtercola boreus TaxID=120213 RepID=A0A3E0VF52_9MICO|nr:hypothetical protein [Subtercola boreus]RFA08566.1 hypothetical protein B7R54_04500 [Subtercola boreus]TQL54499.1 hypothetical protein FB464_2038 [Subtercola boreus]